MILHRRRIPRVVSAGLVLTSGCYETIVFDGAGGRVDAGRVDAGRVDMAAPDLGTMPDVGVDVGAPDLGRRLDEALAIICEGAVECGLAGITYDECVEYLAYQFEYYRETYGEECYDAFLSSQLCAAEALLESDCDALRIGEACAAEFVAAEEACR